jgi:hypothetical protein
MTASSVARTSAKVAVAAALDKIATEVIALDVSEHFALSDIFVIASFSRHHEWSVAILGQGRERGALFDQNATRLDGPAFLKRGVMKRSPSSALRNLVVGTCGD